MSDFNELMGGILNPDNAASYVKINPKEFQYQDSVGNTYALRLSSKGYKTFEIELNWIDKDGNYILNPSLPENVVSEDNLLRGNTVSKIFRDEVLPLVNKKGFTLIAKPFEEDRYSFIKRVLEKFVDTEKMNLEEDSEKTFIISKKRF